MIIANVMEKIRSKSEIINDRLWYVNPNDIEEILEKEDELRRKLVIHEGQKFLDGFGHPVDCDLCNHN